MPIELELFGKLILTFLGLVAPLFAIALSVFKGGIVKLSKRYESDIETIKKQLLEISKDVTEGEAKKMEANLKKLRRTKKINRLKLYFSNPMRQVAWLFCSLMLAFLGVLLYDRIADIAPRYLFLLLVISIIAFVLALVVLWLSINIITEAKELVDEEQKGLLQAVASGASSFLKKVYIEVIGVRVSKEKPDIQLQVDKEQSLDVALRNSELRMAKNIEIGFIFPSEFIIEKKSYYNVYASGDVQIVRYKEDSMQGNTYVEKKPLVITPLAEGRYEIKTFIKAENIEATYNTFVIQILK